MCAYVYTDRYTGLMFICINKQTYIPACIDVHDLDRLNNQYIYIYIHMYIHTYTCTYTQTYTHRR